MSVVNTQDDLTTFSLTEGVLRRGKYGTYLLYGHQSLYWYACVNGLRLVNINPYPTAFPYGNGIVLHFYQQQESSTTKTVHRAINKSLKTYV